MIGCVTQTKKKEETNVERPKKCEIEESSLERMGVKDSVVREAFRERW